MVLLIMICSLIGTVLLIGVCAPLSAASLPTAPLRDDLPSIVIEEPFREDLDTDANCEYGVSCESIGEETTEPIFGNGLHAVPYQSCAHGA